MILSIHSGAGGLEAQDWAEISLECIRDGLRGRTTRLKFWISCQTKRVGKSVTMLVKGPNAYGYLKSEKELQAHQDFSFDTSIEGIPLLPA